MLDSKRRTFNPNGISSSLYAERTDAENSFGNAGTRGVDFLSNGFKIRDDVATVNASNGTFIYMAFADQPGVSPYGTETTGF